MTFEIVHASTEYTTKSRYINALLHIILLTFLLAPSISVHFIHFFPLVFLHPFLLCFQLFFAYFILLPLSISSFLPSSAPVLIRCFCLFSYFASSFRSLNSSSFVISSSLTSLFSFLPVPSFLSSFLLFSSLLPLFLPFILHFLQFFPPKMLHTAGSWCVKAETHHWELLVASSAKVLWERVHSPMLL